MSPPGKLRTLALAVKAFGPALITGHRTNAGVAAYFDLITPEALAFYGEDLHFGYFPTGEETFPQALSAHTDRVGELAGLDQAQEVLDVGCGIATPAIRLAQRYGCRFTGVNLSKEQVRLAKDRVAQHGLNERIRVCHGTALALEFAPASFDSALCLEVAGDICVTEAQKRLMVRELYRTLKPGGLVGFSDLIFKSQPSRQEDRVLQRILYHKGSELLTDWPSLFSRSGFCIRHCQDVLPQTHQTWTKVADNYYSRLEEVIQRYGTRLSALLLQDVARIPDILKQHGSYVMMSAQREE
jgi:cyclopropane fatty-acyl-phospholipid synthase-like methyltransferase